ncbi:proline--tRNA ligase [Paenibacillus sp. y28]|uniref:proline--tRNA ligase n=1 Tax=Paenibacillus sp. y28 TaxID=3129110 RepID=UPI003018910F
MRQSNLLLPTLRETPADAEAVSHQLLLRAGFIRQLASGVYTYLPLGLKVLHHIQAVIREEMDAIGGQQVLLPALQPLDLWEQSGRMHAYGPELIRLTDRNSREFVLGPTHEEVITHLAAQELTSYRKLPVLLYQMQTKFRDERRPRFGLLRCREFLMKDAYSFHDQPDSLQQTYAAVFEAYRRIFTRLGLRFQAVEADAGAIGGKGGSHEFMALADSGEDTVVVCSGCDYAANLEKAEFAFSGSSDLLPEQTPQPRQVHTPDMKSIEELERFLGISAGQIIKTMIYLADEKPVAVCVRGDHEVNETKVKSALGAARLELADPGAIESLVGIGAGFLGPAGLSIPVLLDRHAAAMPEAVTGGNAVDTHLEHVVPGRDFTAASTGDFIMARANDPCPRCGAPLTTTTGIEIGHIFKLGTKYSHVMKALAVTEHGHSEPVIMGCYGIGVSRLLAAIIEQHHDELGMVWPKQASPYQVHLIAVSTRDTLQRQAAEALYEQMRQSGIDVLFDDREERPGVKFKDADLIGIPYQVIIGKAAQEGLVEWKEREGFRSHVTVDGLLAHVKEKLSQP